MAPALKQRLVGAIVLVALAVIFVPMVLDGSGRRAGEKIAVEIPEEPEAPDPAFEQGEPTGTDASNADDATTASATDPTDEATPTASDDAATEAADSEPGGGPSTSATDDAAVNETTDSTVPGEDDGPTATSSPTAWVVQVGSFGQKTNAVVLRDKLRDDGRDAFIEQGETDSGAVWRVRVGPMATREEADKVKKRLDSERDTESLVMSYPE